MASALVSSTVAAHNVIGDGALAVSVVPVKLTSSLCCRTHHKSGTRLVTIWKQNYRSRICTEFMTGNVFISFTS